MHFENMMQERKKTDSKATHFIMLLIYMMKCPNGQSLGQKTD